MARGFARWKNYIYCSPRPPPGSSVFLEVETGLFIPLSYVVWSPFPSLMLTYFKPFSQTLAYDSILVQSSHHSLWLLRLWVQNSQSLGTGLCVTGACPPAAPLLRLLSPVGRQWHSIEFFPVLSDQVVNNFQMDFFYYCYYGSLFWNKILNVHNITSQAWFFVCVGLGGDLPL